MPRRLRRAAGGEVDHVLNRAHGRRPLFHTEKDYAAFERVLAEALERLPVRLLTYCVMPNHFHLVRRRHRGRPGPLATAASRAASS